MARRVTSAATKAKISHTSRVRKGKVHTGVLESTLPKNPAGSRISTPSAGTRGRISLSDLPRESQKNILLGANKRFQKHESERIRAGHQLAAASSSAAQKPNAQNFGLVEHGRANYTKAKSRADASLTHVSNLSASLKPRTSNPAGTKPKTNQGAPKVTGRIKFSDLSVTSQENMIAGARRRSTRDNNAASGFLKPGVINPGPGAVRGQQRANEKARLSAKHESRLYYGSHIGQATAAASSFDEAEQFRAEARRKFSKNPTPSKLAGGGQSRGLGQKAKPSAPVPSVLAGAKKTRTLTDAQKAAKAERARRRRAAKK